MDALTNDEWCSSCGPSVPLAADQRCPKCGGTPRTVVAHISEKLEVRDSLGWTTFGIVEELEHPVLSALGLLLIVIGAASGILWGGPLGWIAGIAVGAVGGWLVQKAIR